MLRLAVRVRREQAEIVLAELLSLAPSAEDTPPADLLGAIRVVAAGDALLAPGATRRLIEEFTRRPEPALRPATAPEEITEREREVLTLISEGHSNKQGALRMQISPRTFESHRAEAMRKLGARNTAELVRSALLHPATG